LTVLIITSIINNERYYKYQSELKMAQQLGKRFENKIVLITGGNSGMGFTTAKRIVDEGGQVIITGRDPESLKRAQAELGPKSEAIRADVSSLQEIDQLFSQIKTKYGRIDALFANAGIAIFNPVEDVTEEIFDNLFDVNVKGVYFTLQKAIPLMSAGAAVVLNASVVSSKGSATNSVYAATKAAVRSMARTFSASYALKGIRFNVISPGPIETPIWGREGGGIPAEALSGVKKAVAETTALKRYGTTDEIAPAVAFLLSSESTYIVGVELFVDGGYTQL
jgi:NAD(P)-dependent dehydrogenase (short-subunit alcohol dehydrogenase family)